jgi:hypothetical protein
MRERAELYGGSLRCGPEPNGGYAVRGKIASPGGVAMSIRVLLADDERLVRAGFRMILQASPISTW